MITIVDYGLGNILAFANVYKKLNIPISVAKNASDLKVASKVILPGVGAFDHAIERLNQSGMRETLDEIVLHDRMPVLGICVGMQMLACSSEEGRLPGLGWIDGHVKKFDLSNLTHSTRLPHMGWNDVTPVAGSGLFNGLESDARFYFLHSYFFECEQQESIVATCSYGMNFSCAVRSGNVYGAQFHPEKSHHYGALLLKNFADM